MPGWFEFAKIPFIFDNWVSMGGEKTTDLHTCVEDDDWVAIIPGDPVALPGNEAGLGMMMASGDPFSFSYLAYLPLGLSDIKDTIGPYHWLCNKK